MSARLTDIQQLVLDYDRLGMKPTDIGRSLGLTVKRVSNVKKRLRQLGYAVSRFRARPDEGVKWIEDGNEW